MSVQEIKPELVPWAKIKVIGCWGAWCKTINRMISENVEGVEFVAINTDAQDLATNFADKKVNIGLNLTRGLWAWADPDIGRKAAEESSDEIKQMLQDTDMVFITCGMGGWTGTGAAPVIGDIALQMWILTVGVITEPFSFEGKKRGQNAQEGIKRMKDSVDTLIIIPNDRIFNVIDKKTTFKQAFSMIDRILLLGVQGISDLIVKPWDINIDFADIKWILKNSWTALLWIGYGSWEKRAVEAARKAIENPLLSNDLHGAKNVIFAVTWGVDLTPIEVQEAASIIEDILDEEVKLIWWMTFDESYDDEIKVTIIATGFEEGNKTSTGNTTARMQSKPSKSEDFITRGVKTLVKEDITEEEPEEDIDTPAFMRKKIS